MGKRIGDLVTMIISVAALMGLVFPFVSRLNDNEFRFFVIMFTILLVSFTAHLIFRHLRSKDDEDIKSDAKRLDIGKIDGSDIYFDDGSALMDRPKLAKLLLKLNPGLEKGGKHPVSDEMASRGWQEGDD